jgi:hypothetical protein
MGACDSKSKSSTKAAVCQAYQFRISFMLIIGNVIPQGACQSTAETLSSPNRTKRYCKKREIPSQRRDEVQLSKDTAIQKIVSQSIEKFLTEISSLQQKNSRISVDQCMILKPSYLNYDGPSTGIPVVACDILSSADVRHWITKFFLSDRATNSLNTSQPSSATQREEILAMFYIGPGQPKTGDWCFSPSPPPSQRRSFFSTQKTTINLYDIFWLIRQTNLHQTTKNLFISSDTSFSGAWIKQLKDLTTPTTTQRLLAKGLCLNSPIKSGLYMRRQMRSIVFPQPAACLLVWQEEKSLLNYLRLHLSIQSSTNATEKSTQPPGIFFADFDVPAGLEGLSYLRNRYTNHYYQHPMCHFAFNDKYLLTLERLTPLFRTIPFLP